MKPTVWKRPTRRTFVALLGAAAAAVVLKTNRKPDTTKPRVAAKVPRWIGHV